MGDGPSASPARIASALEIMLEGPIGARGLQQRVRPARTLRLLPHLRAADPVDGRDAARLPQADHDRRRPGQHPPPARREGRRARRRQAHRARRPGHAASASAAAPPRRWPPAASTRGPRLRLRAARQPRDAAPRQEVIDACWALATRQPDPADPRRRRRRPVERRARSWSTHSRRGGRFELREIPNDEPGMSPHGDLVQRGAGTLRAGRRRRATRRASRRCASASAARSRCIGEATDDGRAASCTTGSSANARSTCRSTSLLGKPPRMLRDVATRAAGSAAGLDLGGIDLREAA